MPDQPEAITEQGRRVATHWSRLAVTPEGARRALEARGIDPAAARPEDLHAVDMIHMGGLTATDTLAELAGIGPGQLVLDAGSGVGGPARRLASRFGARVTGVELSETLHRTAIDLTRLVGLEEKVRLLQGSILSLPFDDASFDAVILQHVAMQISEKGRLFSELARVIRPGGCLALHEIFAGSPSSGPGELHYPLPWATDPGMSALETLPECRSRLAALGLAPGDFLDQSEAGRRFHAASIAAYDRAEGPGSLGLSAQAMQARRAASVATERNLAEGLLRVGMMVARR
ncbi:class I SAM-dependent methyltransferase [Falsiroseomonas sp. E2-1-a20]|uniref:class I SAM-dependent methyltransferase n=1 Tax=Falsiroseomonas sp. E2-1-a20 TaxID=3239300 RepID=UPI003F370271